MMTPEEREWWEPFRRKGARRFILLYGAGWCGGGVSAFLLWTLYRRDDDVFWFLAPIALLLSVGGGVVLGGFLWLLQQGRYDYALARHRTESQDADTPRQ